MFKTSYVSEQEVICSQAATIEIQHVLNKGGWHNCLVKWIWPTDSSSCQEHILVFTSFYVKCSTFNGWVDWMSGSMFPHSNFHRHTLIVWVKWLFNNIPFTANAQGPVPDYKAITCGILVWTCWRNLMCLCDERFSLSERVRARGVQVRNGRWWNELAVCVTVACVIAKYCSVEVRSRTWKYSMDKIKWHSKMYTNYSTFILRFDK